MSRSESGVPSWKLVASSAVLHESRSEALLSSPFIELFKEGRLNSQVSSQSGLLHTDTQNVTLTGSVLVRSMEDHSTLKTDSLDYLSAKKQFVTDRPVLIERPGSVTRGVGMTASSDLSEVRVHHQESRGQ